MTATRVIDDHIELANIGTKTHTEIEGHIQGIGNYAFPSADGNADQILKSNGAGALSWIDQPAGFACGSLNACNLSDIGTRAHSSLTGMGASDHHTKYLDSEAILAMGAKGDANPLHHDKMIGDAVHVRDNSTGNWAVPNTTIYTLDWGNDAQVEFDYGGLFDTGASDRITIQKAGLYLLSTNIVFSGNPTGSYRCTYIYVNGALLKYECNAFSLLARGFNQLCLTTLKLEIDDYIEVKVYQDSGGVLSVTARAIYDGLWLTMLREV